MTESAPQQAMSTCMRCREIFPVPPIGRCPQCGDRNIRLASPVEICAEPFAALLQTSREALTEEAQSNADRGRIVRAGVLRSIVKEIGEALGLFTRLKAQRN